MDYILDELEDLIEKPVLGAFGFSDVSELLKKALDLPQADLWRAVTLALELPVTEDRINGILDDLDVCDGIIIKHWNGEDCSSERLIGDENQEGNHPWWAIQELAEYIKECLKQEDLQAEFPRIVRAYNNQACAYAWLKQFPKAMNESLGQARFTVDLIEDGEIRKRLRGKLEGNLGKITKAAGYWAILRRIGAG